MSILDAYQTVGRENGAAHRFQKKCCQVQAGSTSELLCTTEGC